METALNLLLLDDADFINANTAKINDERLTHVLKILKSTVGDTLQVGKVNGLLGTAQITAIDNTALQLQVDLQQSPPPALPLCLVLALPRPQMLKRILQNIAEFGIKELHLIHSNKVEKSYWQTPNLQTDAIAERLKQGLSQAKDTVMPTVHLHPRFKPFVEDVLPKLIAEREAFIAHPYSAQTAPTASPQPRVLVVGPEGGFNDYEVQQIQQQGVQAFNMGPRIYKVENAVSLLSQQLSCLA